MLAPEFKINIPDGIDYNKKFTYKVMEEEKESFLSVAKTIWDPNVLSDIEINDSVIEVIVKAEKSIMQCSKAVNWIPEPPTSPSSTLSSLRSYIVKYFRMVIVNNIETYKNYRYKICINAAALNFRSELVDSSYNGS